MAATLVKNWPPAKTTQYMLSAGLIPVYVSFEGKTLSPGWEDVTEKDSEKYVEEFFSSGSETPLMNVGVALTEASGLIGIRMEQLDTQVDGSKEQKLYNLMKNETVCVKYEPFIAFLFKRDAVTASLVDAVNNLQSSAQVLESDYVPFLGSANWLTGGNVAIVHGYKSGALTFAGASQGLAEGLQKID